ncbi:hypothetical protein AX16_007873 [Volvariella volvacea WC 439]|nr:hypothetical protein AX16_007873 [Volvariella volvacea WC 439]
MSRFPTEILQAILSEVAPPLNERLWPRSHDKSDQLRHGREHQVQVPHLAQLREVCSFWYQVITPILYSIFILTLIPREKMLRQLAGLQLHPNLIRHLVLSTDGYWHELRAMYFQDAELVERTLSLCTNLRTLQLINIEGVFLDIRHKDRSRIFQSSRQALSKLTTVIIGSKDNDAPHPAISTVLIGLGQDICNNLTNLEISCGALSRMLSIKLPSSFPNLSRLHLRFDNQVSLFCVQLLSRIFRREEGSSLVVPLQELILESTCLPPSVEWVDLLLRINGLRSTLRILDLRIHQGWHQQRDAEYWASPSHEQVALHVLETCPSLIAFHYFTLFPSDILHSLPSRLREVGLQVTVQWDISPLERNHLVDLKPIINWIQSQGPGGGVKEIVVSFVSVVYDFTLPLPYYGTAGRAEDKILEEIPIEMLEDWAALQQECSARSISLVRYRE